MRILLTGSNGFLGKSIFRNFSMLYSVTTLSRNNSNILCDLVENIPKISNFDVIIHAAGKAHLVSKSKIGNDTFYGVNVKGTKNLLRGIDLSGNIPKSFVFISSVSVYGLDQGQNINENSPLLAKDPYGLSKVQAERFILDWCQENKVVCTILRLPLLVGENPPGNLGSMLLAIKKGYYFNIAGGKAKKSMLLAEDVAKIILNASEIGGIFNLTDGSHPSFYELSNAVAISNGKKRLFNMPFLIAKIIALFGDILGDKFPLNSIKLKKITTDLTFDDGKARQLLGWNPKKVLEYYIN